MRHHGLAVTGLGAAMAVATFLAPAPASAHETHHEVRRGEAVAVRAYLAGGRVLAGAAYQVHAPDGSKVPWQEGRTDRNGWLAFVPDAPGRWRVRILDGRGHGHDVVIEHPAPGGQEASAGARAAPGPSAAFALRPLLGLAAIGAVFGALFLFHRRKRAAP